MGTMIDDATLVEYADTFRTYGNRSGRHWFLGLEEGGAEGAADIERRLEGWVEAGRPGIEALSDGTGTDAAAHFDASRPGGAKPHPTWAAQIRVQLGIEGAPDTAAEIARRQAFEHGTADGDTCLLELLPLPSPSPSRWLYGRLSREARFASRAACQAHYLEPRLARIDALVREHRPATLAMFCWSMREALTPFLADTEAFEGPEPSRPGRAIVGTWGDTVAAITYPPSFPFTAPNGFYRALGARMGERADAPAGERPAARSRAA